MSQIRKIRRRQQGASKPPRTKYPKVLLNADYAELEARIMSQLPDVEDLYNHDPHVVFVDSLSAAGRAPYDLLERHRAMGLESRVLTVVSEHDQAMRRLESQLEEALKRLDPIFPRIR